MDVTMGYVNVLPPLERVVDDRLAIPALMSVIDDLVVRAYTARRDSHPSGIVVRVQVLERYD